MRKAIKIILPLVILGGSFGVAMLMMASRSPAARVTAPPLPVVQVISVTPADVAVELRARGLVEAAEELVVSAQVAGQIVEVSPRLEVGLDVAAGEWLATLDTADFRLEVERLDAEVARARLELQRRRLELELAEEEWEELGQGATGPLSLRKQEVLAAEATLTAALASARRAKLDLERCRIHAPSAGRVQSRSVALGAYVSSGQALASLLSLEHAEIRLPIPADDVAFLPALAEPGHAGPPVTVITPAGRRWPGRLVRSEGQLDRRSRVLYLVAQVDDPFRAAGERLEIGELVETSIPGRRLAGVIAIPRSSLRAGNRVLVAEEGRLRSQVVEVAWQQSDLAFISEGLEGGERVCVSLLETFVEDMQVEEKLVSFEPPAEIPSRQDPPESSESALEPDSSGPAEPAPDPESGGVAEPAISAEESGRGSDAIHPAAVDPAAADPAARYVLRGMETQSSGEGGVKITLLVEQGVQLSQFTLSEPRRHVVDLRSTRLAADTRRLEVGAAGLRRIRVAEHRDATGGMTTRVVFDLDGEAVPRVSAEAGKLVFSFPDLRSP